MASDKATALSPPNVTGRGLEFRMTPARSGLLSDCEVSLRSESARDSRNLQVIDSFAARAIV